MWVAKNWQIDKHRFLKYFWKTVVLNVSLQVLFYFVQLTDLSARKQLSSSMATKEELPGTIISNKAEMVPDIE